LVLVVVGGGLTVFELDLVADDVFVEEVFVAEDVFEVVADVLVADDVLETVVVLVADEDWLVDEVTDVDVVELDLLVEEETEVEVLEETVLEDEELEPEPEPGLGKVDPISPQRTLLCRTDRS
jgi:hypothetical protein